MKYSFLAFVALLVACQPKKIDTSAMKTQMKQMEVKRITDAHIVSFATQFGKEIVMQLEKEKNSQQLAQSLSNQYDADIALLDMSNPNTLSAPTDPKEKELLSAIDFAMKHKQEIPDNIQKLAGGDSLLFLKPNAKFPNALWRVCMSKKGVIQAVSVKEIKKKTTE
jgi:hypothetical protein